MRRFSISELDARAPEFAIGRGLGLEIIGFCTAERMEDENLLASEELRLRPFARKSLHAPYYELTPCAIDSLIGRVSLHRYRQAVQTSMRLGIRRMVVHSGYAPQMYFPEWFVPKSIEFWKEFVRELPEETRVEEATYRARLAICDACARRTGFTCTLCGCYVQTRAAKRAQRCPEKRWDRQP